MSPETIILNIVFLVTMLVGFFGAKYGLFRFTTLVADSLTLVQNGMTRGRLYVGRDGITLEIRSANGTCRHQLSCHGKEVFVKLYDTNGVNRLQLYVIDEGPGLGIMDAHGQCVGQFSIQNDNVGLALYDKNSNRLGSIVVIDNEASIRMG